MASGYRPPDATSGLSIYTSEPPTFPDELGVSEKTVRSNQAAAAPNGHDANGDVHCKHGPKQQRLIRTANPALRAPPPVPSCRQRSRDKTLGGDEDHARPEGQSQPAFEHHPAAAVITTPDLQCSRPGNGYGVWVRSRREGKHGCTVFRVHRHSIAVSVCDELESACRIERNAAGSGPRRGGTE